MAFVKVDDMLPLHPRIRPLSNPAFRLYIDAICWASRQRADGHIRTSHLCYVSDIPRRDQYAAELVDARLWQRSIDGWQIVDGIATPPSAGWADQAEPEGDADIIPIRAYPRSRPGA